MSGDEEICKVAKEMIPGITTVSSKSFVGAAAKTKHPTKVRREIQEGMEKALTGDYKTKCAVDLPEHFVAEVEYKEWPEANKYSNYPGAKRSGLKSISFESSDYVEVLRFIMFCL